MMLILGSPSIAFSQMRLQGGFGGPLIYAMAALLLPLTLVLFIGLPMILLMGLAGGEDAGLALAGVGLTMLAFVLVGLVFGSLVMVPINLFVGAGINHVCLMLVGGARRDYETTFRVTCYVQGAAIPLSILLSFFCLGFVPGIWMLIVTIIGLSKAHDIPTGKAALAVLLPTIAAFILFILMFLFMGLLGAIAEVAG